MMRYAELHCKTNFSFLEGASHADELVKRASELGYAALAVTDRESLAGVVRAHMAAKETGLKLLIGAEIHPADAASVVLWATDRKSYGRLSRLLTVGRRRAEKGQCQLTFADIAEHAEGLIAGVITSEQGTRDRGQGKSSKFKIQSSKSKEETTDEQSTKYLVPSTQYEAATGKPNLHLFHPDNHSLFPSPESLAPYADIFPHRSYLLAELFLGLDDA